MRKLIVSYLVLLLSLQGIAQERTFLHASAVHHSKLWSPQKGKPLRIDATNKLLAIVFLSPECPMSVSYTKTLRELQQDYPADLQIIAIVPGRTIRDAQINNFAATYDFKFPIYVDRRLDLVKRMRAEVTPEVFLFDRNGAYLYSGAVDDWLGELGKKKSKPEQHYLRNAINSFLVGVPQDITYVKAQGCLINDF